MSTLAVEEMKVSYQEIGRSLGRNWRSIVSLIIAVVAYLSIFKNQEMSIAKGTILSGVIIYPFMVAIKIYLDAVRNKSHD